MLNYSVHALEELRRYKHLPTEDQRGLEEVLTLLHKAVKFELPENGTLFGDDYNKGYDVLNTDLLHLPFPIVALEYHFSYYHGDPLLSFASPKRIALAFDYESCKDSLFGQVAKKYAPRLIEVGGVILIPICTLNDGRWMVQPWGIIIPRYEPDGTNLSVFRYGKPVREAQIGFLTFPVLPYGCHQLIEKMGANQAITNGLKDAGEEITSLVGLLAALSCSNVKLENSPAPTKLNAKRAKSGKLPFYEYKVVTVEVTRSVKGAAREFSQPVTGRMSPREHLRRGHIRRLATGKNVWVQAAIIGSGKRGHIEKEYKVK